MTDMRDAAAALGSAVNGRRGRMSIEKGRVGAVDATASPNLFTVNGRKMTMIETGEAVTEGDLVAYLVVGSKAVGLGKLMDD